MTIEAIRCLCRGPELEVSVLFYEHNGRLQQELTTIAGTVKNLTLFPTEFRSTSLQAFRSLISLRKVSRLRQLLKRINPDAVLVSQGRIEAGSLCLLAANRSGIRTVSYLPMAHSVNITGRLGAIRLRNFVNGYLYSLPDEFITISRSARDMLTASGLKQKISIVPNGIKLQPLRNVDRTSVRGQLGIRNDECLAGMVGRIDFRQKAQNFLVETVSLFRDRLDGFKFVLVGEGPDEHLLRSMISSRNLQNKITLLPWCENPARIYAGLDMLLIPSKFEGVPLVMLEAMSHELAIAASATDGMAELLPSDWLFPFGNHQAFLDTLLGLRNRDHSELLRRNRTRVVEEFCIERFCSALWAALVESHGDCVTASGSTNGGNIASAEARHSIL